MAAQSGVSQPEARSGLAPWVRAELPPPPIPHGLGWIAVVGPGVIILGASIGSGEFLLGPATFVRHGLSLLWATGVAVLLQTVFNIELMRYTIATGEPIVTGFMRTRPSSTLWAWFYAALYFLQFGWPAWAANAAGGIFFLMTRRVAGPADASAVFYVGVATFLACVAILLVGRRIERTLEVLNWFMVVCILGGFVVLDLLFVPVHTWITAAAGFGGFDLVKGRLDPLPRGADFFLIAGLVAYAGAGGVANLTLTNWARDKGYGMGSRAGYISGALGGEKINLAHTGFIFSPDAEGMHRWRGWWRIIRADQWGVFFTGALLGMALPSLLYVTFVPHGTDIRGFGIAAALAASMGERLGPTLAIAVAFLGAWLLFKTQLDAVDGLTRSVTDILWTGSHRIRGWRGGDVRTVYYAVLAALVVWGVAALRIAQPIILLQLAANIAGFVLIFASLQLLYVNTRLLPRELRPPTWRRAALVATALFYSFFLALSIRSFIS